MLLPLMLLFAPPSSADEKHRRDMTAAEAVQMTENMSGHGAEHEAGNMDAAPLGQMGAASPDLAADASVQKAIAANRVRSAGDFLGRVHPFAVHFPIALLLLAALAEIFMILRPAAGGQIIVRFLVAGGAVGAVAAALLGWFAGGWRLADRSEALALHRWNGTAIAAVSLAAAWLAFRPGSRTAFRAILTILAVALLVQGYLGGEMVFGPNHLGLL
jgi:uncharacterized membrane protein